MIWDHTDDGLLYCYAWSRMWDRKTVDKYIPESLRFIVGFDDIENDRFPYYGKAKNNMYLRYWLPMAGVDGGNKKKAISDDEPKQKGGPGQTQKPNAQDGSWMSGFGTGFGAW